MGRQGKALAPSPPFWAMHHGGAVSCNIVEPEGLSYSFLRLRRPTTEYRRIVLREGFP